MQEISTQEVIPNIMALFNLTKPTMPCAFNVLEGVTRGQIFVDDEITPIWAVIREEVYGTLYFGGQINTELASSLVGRFRKSWLGSWVIETSRSIIGTYGGERNSCISASLFVLKLTTLRAKM